jgi:hypothetical protein
MYSGTVLYCPYTLLPSITHQYHLVTICQLSTVTLELPDPRIMLVSYMYVDWYHVLVLIRAS